MILAEGRTICRCFGSVATGIDCPNPNKASGQSFGGQGAPNSMVTRRAGPPRSASRILYVSLRGPIPGHCYKNEGLPIAHLPSELGNRGCTGLAAQRPRHLHGSNLYLLRWQAYPQRPGNQLLGARCHCLRLRLPRAATCHTFVRAIGVRRARHRAVLQTPVGVDNQG